MSAKSKVTDRLTELQMLQLAVTYKEYDCLWNPVHEFYKDKEVRERTYKELLNKLNIPGLTVKDIPQKIKNLRSSYYQEIKKIDKSKKDGATGDAVYRPKVSWFPIAQEIMGGSKSQHGQYMTNRPETTLRRGSRDSTQETISSLDSIAENVTSRPTNVTSQQNITSPHIIPPQPKNEDEFDSFGQYIATTLRSMPREMSIIAKTELQKTLSEIQLMSIRQRNQTILPVECTASSSVYSQSEEYLTSTTDFSSNIKDEFVTED